MRRLSLKFNKGYPRSAQTAPHVRDTINLSKVMNLWLLAVLPCALFGIWNTGYQANWIMSQLGIAAIPDWRAQIFELFGIGHDADNFWHNLWHGLAYFLPIFLIAWSVSAAWECLFAYVRKKQRTEGALLFAILLTLTLPPNIPLWQVAVGVSFAIVLAKEVFGGTGRNIVHPVLAARAFLYFAYPDQIIGDTIWTAVDNVTGATALASIKAGGLNALTPTAMTVVGESVTVTVPKWTSAFIGTIPGSVGETSTLACVIGALILFSVRLLSWRVVVGGVLGLVATTYLFNLIGGDANPIIAVPWHWHLVLGGFAFGLVFLATDPVTSAHTNIGRWIYGFVIGVLVILIRVTNATIPEGMMFAILLASVFAPLIDHIVIHLHVRRRRARFVTNQVAIMEGSDVND